MSDQDTGTVCLVCGGIIVAIILFAANPVLFIIILIIAALIYALYKSNPKNKTQTRTTQSQNTKKTQTRTTQSQNTQKTHHKNPSRIVIETREEKLRNSKYYKLVKQFAKEHLDSNYTYHDVDSLRRKLLNNGFNFQHNEIIRIVNREIKLRKELVTGHKKNKTTKQPRTKSQITNRTQKTYDKTSSRKTIETKEEKSRYSKKNELIQKFAKEHLSKNYTYENIVSLRRNLINSGFNFQHDDVIRLVNKEIKHQKELAPPKKTSFSSGSKKSRKVVSNKTQSTRRPKTQSQTTKKIIENRAEKFRKEEEKLSNSEENKLIQKFAKEHLDSNYTYEEVDFLRRKLLNNGFNFQHDDVIRLVNKEIKHQKKLMPPKKTSISSGSKKPRKVVSDHRRSNQKPSNPTDINIIDINSASEEEIASLPGIGPILAKKVINIRKSNNGFNSFEEFSMSLGLKPHVAKRIADQVMFTPVKKQEKNEFRGRIIDF